MLVVVASAAAVVGCPASRSPTSTTTVDAAIETSPVEAVAPSPSSAPPETVASAPSTASSSPPDPSPANLPVAVATPPLKGRCLDVRTLEASGETHSCYPYRCVVDRCLEKCTVAQTHCAPFAGPGMDPAKFGWPLECILGRCVPMNPNKVYPKGGP